jgi:Ca2+/H+ antiporter, TMEM165/GDT1 family
VTLRNAFTAFATVFPAELPDKTMVATLVLSSRYRQPFITWLGVSAAFVVHVGVAVTAGSLIGRLNPKIVSVVTACIFAFGSFSLWRESRKAAHAEASGEVPIESATIYRVAAASFLAVLVAEWGDLTQLATASLAAKRHDAVGVGIGALLALWSVAALAAVAGRSILRVLPISTVQRVAAVLFAALAAWSLVELVR